MSVTFKSSTGAIAVAVLAIGTAARAAVVFHDDFTGYSDNAAVQAAWSSSGAIQDAITSLDGSTTITGLSYYQVGNYRSKHPIGQALAGDWTLSFGILHNSYSRAQRIGLMNADGTQGYVATWGSNNNTQFGGEGSVNIAEADLDAEWSIDNPTLANLGTLGRSSHPATGFAWDSNLQTYSDAFEGFEQMELSWTASTGDLTFRVNGDVRVTATDTSFNEFSMIYNGHEYQRAV